MSGTSVRSGAVGCLVHVAAIGLLGLGVGRAIAPHVPEAVGPWVAGAAAVLLVLGLSSFWSLARGYGRGDGPMVATGRARPLGAALRAPISGVECVAYAYRMYDRASESEHERRRRLIPVYWGYASRPFRVECDSDAPRVLAVPRLADAARRCSAPDDVERARRHVAAVPFEETRGGLAGVLGTTLELSGEVFGDEDGESRRDWKRAGEDRDPGALFLEEAVVPVDARVTIVGRWSAERQAIVAGPDDPAWGPVTVVRGGPERLGTAHAQPSSPASVAVAATLLTAAGAGIVALALTGRLAGLLETVRSALR